MALNDDTQLALLNEKIGALHQDFGEMKGVLKELSQAITKLALVEHQQTQAAIAQERILRLVEALTTRIVSIETTIPEIRRAASWIDRGVLAVVFTLFVAMAGMYFKT